MLAKNSKITFQEGSAAPEQTKVVVVGLGEVGKPLLALLSKHYETVGVDLVLPEHPLGKVDVLHVCYPFEIKDFMGETARYIDLFKPSLTVINSTVAIGTTRAVAERTGTKLAHSPVRGKHVRMLEELSNYVKFIGPIVAASGKHDAEVFKGAGRKKSV